MSLEKRVGVLSYVAIGLLVICALRVTYWQLIRADQLLPAWLSPLLTSAGPSQTGSAEMNFTDLNALPQPLLQRTAAFLNRVTRGSIYDRDGRLLASDRVAENGDRTRFYEEPSLAHVIGYTSSYRTGLSGLELSYNDALLGIDRVDSRVGELFHQPITGSDLVLTIDSELQRSADRALEGKAGSVVVLDAKSGAVLAMASAPRFDPNQILQEGYAAGLADACGDAPTCRAPFLNRATQAQYAPGSTFKTVMLIAGLETGQVSPGTEFDFGEPMTGANGPYYVYRVTGGGVIPDYNHKEQKLDLKRSYDLSANAAFARIGDEMPAEVLIEYARRFGFSPAQGETGLPVEIESSPSQLAVDLTDLTSDNMLRASTGIGQGELLTSPLNMASVVLSVVNDGNLPVPYLVDRVKDPQGRVVRLAPNRRLVRALIKPETARTVRQMMISVVKNGTGQAAAVPGLEVGGKTGTAQVGGSEKPHAWFTGFAKGKDRSVVIVVVIENGGEGSRAAAPIFAQLAKLAVGE